MNIRKQVIAVLCLFGFATGVVFAQGCESIDAGPNELSRNRALEPVTSFL